MYNILIFPQDRKYHFSHNAWGDWWDNTSVSAILQYKESEHIILYNYKQQWHGNGI